MSSTLNLKGIAATGGGMNIDTSNYSTLDLKGVAAATSSSGAKTVLKNIASKSTLDLKGIASAGKGCVIFNFT